jgi:hypothetical protein
MAKKHYPNVLNNLLKGLRQKHFGRRSGSKVAETIGVLPAYIAKIESGEITRPSTKQGSNVLSKLIALYSPYGDWEEPLTLLAEAVETNALSNDPPFRFTAFKKSLLSKIPVSARTLSVYSILPLDLPRPDINKRAYTIVSFDRFISATIKESFYRYSFGVLYPCRSTSGFIWPHLNYFNTCADITCFDGVILVGDWFGRTFVTAEPSVIEVWTAIFNKMTELCIPHEDLQNCYEMQEINPLFRPHNCPEIKVPPDLVSELPTED